MYLVCHRLHQQDTATTKASPRHCYCLRIFWLFPAFVYSIPRLSGVFIFWHFNFVNDSHDMTIKGRQSFRRQMFTSIISKLSFLSNYLSVWNVMSDPLKSIILLLNPYVTLHAKKGTTHTLCYTFCPISKNDYYQSLVLTRLFDFPFIIQELR